MFPRQGFVFCWIMTFLDGYVIQSSTGNKRVMDEVVHTVPPNTVVHSNQADMKEYAHRPSASLKSYMMALFPYAYTGFPFNYYGYPYDYKYGFPVGHGIYRQTHQTEAENFKCPKNGHFYRNEVSFYSCANDEFRVLFCAPGSKNGPKEKYDIDDNKKLSKEDYCSVNMVGNGQSGSRKFTDKNP